MSAQQATKGNGQTQTVQKPSQPSLQDRLEQILQHTVEFKPFMEEENIRLSPAMVMNYFAKRTKKGLLPTPQQAMKFVMLCKARALNPWEGDVFLVGYDTDSGPEFNLITAHQALLKRAEVHPEYDGMESGITIRGPDGGLLDVPGDLLDEGQTILGGWARVHFKTRKVPTYRRLKLSTFSTGKSRWQADPCGMICKCAEADALRSSFPTKCGGMYLREELDSVDGREHSQLDRQDVPMPKAIDDIPAEPSPPAGEPEPASKPEAEPAPEPAPVDEVPDVLAAWQAKLAKDPNLEQVNDMAHDLPSQTNDIRNAAWKMLLEHCKKNGVAWNKTELRFEPVAQ